MPEGDTIHRTANRMRPVLVDRPLVSAEAPRLLRPMPPAGTVVTDVVARGKHLLVSFDNDEVLHTHMRMTGSWHTYPIGARWQRPRRGMRVVLANATVQAVCFDAPVVELVDARVIERHPALVGIGPDLITEPDAVAAAMERLATLGVGDVPLIELLLDQRVAAGIGNVYANELCFLLRLDPRTPAAAVALDELARAFDLGASLLRANVHRAHRTTLPGRSDGSLWVYGRGGRPCRRCATSIVQGRVGAGARPTYWCPSCQPPTGLGLDQRLAP